MKRIPKELKEDYGITLIKPWIFWKRCDICSKEVKGESMWKILVRVFDLGEYLNNQYHYSCTSCLKNIEEVIKYRKNILAPPSGKPKPQSGTTINEGLKPPKNLK